MVNLAQSAASVIYVLAALCICIVPCVHKYAMFVFDLLIPTDRFVDKTN